MKKTNASHLRLHKETLRELSLEEARRVVGGEIESIRTCETNVSTCRNCPTK